MSRDSRRPSGHLKACYIGKFKAAGKRPWRWDVTEYQMDDGEYPGVHNVATHINHLFGYTRTYLGALYQVSKGLKDN